MGVSNHVSPSSGHGHNHDHDHGHGHSATAHAHPVGPSVVTSVDGGRKARLWKKLRMLQYLKQLYNKYKTAYTNEYHDQPAVVLETPAVLHTPLAPRPVLRTPVLRTPVIRTPVVRTPVLRRPVRRQRPAVARIPSVARVPAVARIPVAAADYDYDLGDFDYGDYGDYDYYDYSDYSDYDLDGRGGGGCGAGGCGGGCGGVGGCGGGCGGVGGCGVAARGCGEAGCKGNLFARIVKAVKAKRQRKNGRDSLLKDLSELFGQTEVDYENFGAEDPTLSVDSLLNRLRKGRRERLREKRGKKN